MICFSRYFRIEIIKKRIFWFIPLLLMLSGMNTVHAEHLNQESKTGHTQKRFLAVPFPYFNDTIGSGIGVAAIAEGYIQDQMLTVCSGMFGTDGNYLTFLMVRDYHVPFMKQLILNPQISVGSFSDVLTYTMDNPDFPDDDAGSNDSDKDNYIKADGDDFWFEFNMKYLLPIGNGKKHIYSNKKLDNGLLVSAKPGGTSWNPLDSGRTYVEFTPFYRNQDLVADEKIEQKTAGFDFALTFDNQDFSVNPSNGSYYQIYVSRDWGEFGSSRPWTVMGGEANKYFDLGTSETARQRVLALSFWTVDCLTWNSSHTENQEEVFHRPPTYKGATLGGLFRLRGYPSTRFNDRSAIYYGLEYRHTLNWNPLKRFTLNGRLDVGWFQLVGFSEIGRVAPNWSLDGLHKDMKWCLGAGVRTMVNNLIIRADLAASEEDAILQLFIGQPF
jgi:hypothetical protein